MVTSIGVAQQAGPYKVLKTAEVGGAGNFDYVYADVDGRRLYIPRTGTPARITRRAEPPRGRALMSRITSSSRRAPSRRRW